jgi:hypothetical protein
VRKSANYWHNTMAEHLPCRGSKGALAIFEQMWRSSEQECARLEARNEQLLAALQRIDGINDNPAVFNPMIEEVLRSVLPQTDELT